MRALDLKEAAVSLKLNPATVYKAMAGTCLSGTDRIEKMAGYTNTYAVFYEAYEVHYGRFNESLNAIIKPRKERIADLEQ
jgi:hypothetical protein